MGLTLAGQDLEARRGIATDSHVVRGVLVQQVFEVVRERAGEAATRGFARSVQDKAAFASVGALEFLDLLAGALERLAPLGASAEDFYEEVGRRAVASVRDTTIGRTFVSMADGDPVRLFERLGSGPSVLVAFGERRVLEAAPNQVRIAFTGSVLPPRIFAGMYCAMAEGVGARDARCVSAERELGETEYVLTWSQVDAQSRRDPLPRGGRGS